MLVRKNHIENPSLEECSKKEEQSANLTGSMPRPGYQYLYGRHFAHLFQDHIITHRASPEIPPIDLHINLQHPQEYLSPDSDRQAMHFTTVLVEITISSS